MKPDLRQLGLTPTSVTLMRRLDDGPEEDSVGLEMDDMTGRELQTTDQLIAKIGEIVPGWQVTVWYQLTPRGQDMLRVLTAMGL